MKTQLIASVETSVGTAMPAEPCSVACRQRHAVLEQPVGVLDGHCGIVDQDADREREAAQRHGIERVAKEIQARREK